MLAQAGIALAAVTMLAWGVGDFMIQKSSRRLGDWETLFAITAFGAIVLSPFALRNLPALFENGRDIAILAGSALFLTAAAIFEIESFKRGKMSVVETLVPFEVPAASILAFLVLGDMISPLQLFLIIALIVGLFMVSLRSKSLTHRMLAEKGVYLGLAGALLMGVADFFLGWGSRATDPVTANFIINIVMALTAGGVIVARGGVRKMFRDVAANRSLVLSMSIIDNMAWVAYAYAMTAIPIAIATGLSETSCVIAVLLGIFVNRERLQRHQHAGLVIALAAAIVLAFITS